MPRGIGGGESLDFTDALKEERDRFWAKTASSGRHRIWTAATTTNKGTGRRYGQTMFRGSVRTASRVSAALVAPISAGSAVWVGCDDDLCVASHCLRVGTPAEAMTAAQRRHPRWEQVQEARTLYLRGCTHADLLGLFDFSHAQLTNVLANRRYRDPGYDPGAITLRRNHPERFRFSDEEIEEIRSEMASGTSINRIATWLQAPGSTVWEAAQGKSSHVSRRLT